VIGIRKIAECHDNVDVWLKSNPKHVAVRGWVVNASYGADVVGLTAHSVVRDAAGTLFDITPVTDERIRPGMVFVPHLGDDASFHRLRSGTGISFICPPQILDNLQSSFSGEASNPFNEIEHW
jgi:hypothetical protein